MVVSNLVVLATVVLGSEMDESALLQSKATRHTDLHCLSVQKGEIAPVTGFFVDASNSRVSVQVGDVADQDGQFCVSAASAALLQRTHVLQDAETINFDEAVAKKKRRKKKKQLEDGVMTDAQIEDLFSLKSLGPFPLVKRSDVIVELSSVNQSWSAMVDTGTSLSGNLASTMKLDLDGAAFWLGASEVDWAYQANDADAVGSFEEYGGFIFRRAGVESDEVYEIGINSEESEQEMTVRFSWPFQMTEEDWNKCSNPAPVTIQSMLDAGAEEYCWEVDHDYCERGCFIYKTTKGYQGFSVKSFALDAIGPFYLEDILSAEHVEVQGSKWISGNQSGDISTGMKELGTVGRNFWFNASEVTWAYQGTSSGISSNSFHAYGGFVLQAEDGSATHVLRIAETNENSMMTLEFGPPFEISRHEWDECQNPAQVTIDAMSDAGAEQYCWEQHWERCPRGCFFYKVKNGYQAFAVQDFAMASLGPFDLSIHVSNAFNLELNENTWTLDGQTGRLGAEAEVPGWAGTGWNRVRWLYPAPEANDSASSFDKTGGFHLCLDENRCSILQIDAGNPQVTVFFDEPMHITAEEWAEAGCDSNAANITLAKLVAIGTEKYCWVVPHDGLCPQGCFYYKTRTGYQSFGIHS